MFYNNILIINDYLSKLESIIGIADKVIIPGGSRDFNKLFLFIYLGSLRGMHSSYIHTF